MFKLDNRTKIIVITLIGIIILSHIDFRCGKKSPPPQHTKQIDSLLNKNQDVHNKVITIIDSETEFTSKTIKDINHKKSKLDENIQAIKYLPIDTILNGISRELSKESSNK